MIASFDGGYDILITYEQGSGAVPQRHFEVARRSRHSLFATGYQHTSGGAGIDCIYGGGHGTGSRPERAGYVQGAYIAAHIQGGGQQAGAQLLLVGRGGGSKKQAIDTLVVYAV
ncbi:hypothetical protein ES703_54250 [subsurface metagenome]